MFELTVTPMFLLICIVLGGIVSLLMAQAMSKVWQKVKNASDEDGKLEEGK